MFGLSGVQNLSPDAAALKRLIIREPISIFSQIKNVKDEEKKEKLTQLLERLKKNLPEGFKIGAAVSAGDCFFDSVAQSLNQLKLDVDLTVKTLRQVCCNVARKELSSSESCIGKAIKKDKQGECGTIEEYVPRIRFTVEDIKNASSDSEVEILNLKNAIWGNLEIEGKMISDMYNVVLHLYSINEEYGQKITVTELIPDDNDENVFIEGENLDRLRTDNSGRVVRILNYKKHFVPILSNLKEDIEEAIEVSREEIYGIPDNNSHSLMKIMRNSKESYDKKQGNYSDSKDKDSKRMNPLETVGDGNCFFHAVFGNNSSGTYKAERAQDMRMEWHKFLSQFKSLDDANMPAPLNCEIKKVFNMFLEKPGDLTGYSQKIKELAEETKEKIDKAGSEAKKLKEKIIAKFHNDGEFRKVIYPVIERAITQYNERNDDSPRDQKTLLSIEDLLKEENKERLYNHITEDLESCALIFNPILSNKEYSNTYNPNIIKDSFVNNKAIYQAYLEAIKGKDYFIFIEEIPMLASLANIKINVQYKNEGQDVQTEFIPNLQMINSNYEKKRCIMG